MIKENIYGGLVMGRPRKTLSLEEQLEKVNEEIEMYTEKIKNLKKEKRELEEKLKDQKKEELYQAVMQSGKTIDEVLEAMKENK